MNKKIIFFAPNIEDGGLEKNIISLSNYFVSKNTNVEIVYSKISSKVKRKLDKKVSLSKSNIKLEIPIFNDRINNSIKCFLYILLKLKSDKFDKILSFQDHPFAICCSLIRKKKSIIRIANHPFGSLFFFNNKIKFIVKIFIKIFFYQFSNLIISNSKQSTRYFKKYIFNPKKCITIYNPILLLNKSNTYKRDKNLIISVGRLEKQKNFENLIKAIRICNIKNNKIRLYIIGKGRERKNLQKLRNKYNLRKIIHFTGYKNPDEYYKKSGIFVLSSYFEGLPNVLIEAINYGLPIISSDCFSGPREILKNNKYGSLYKVGDYKDLANKIIIANRNYYNFSKKIKLAKKDLKRFSFNLQCKKYLDTINAL